MKESFELMAKKGIIQVEGGYTNDPNDNGGPTNWGITFRVLGAYRKLGRPATIDEVKKLSKKEAIEIYKFQYWDAVRGDLLAKGLDYAVFDMAVNSGPSRAIKILQKMLGVGVDGNLGAFTLDAANKRQDADPNFALDYLDATLEWRKTLRGPNGWAAFGRGWTNRVNAVKKNVKVLQAMEGISADTKDNTTETISKTQAAKEIVPIPQDKAAQAPANVENKGFWTTTIGKWLGTLGVGLTGQQVADAAIQARENLAGYVDYAPIVKYVFVAVVLVAAGGIAYKVIKGIRSEEDQLTQS